MTQAFIFITVEPGAEEHVLADLKGIDWVKEAHPVYGQYDLLIKLVTPDMPTLRTTILTKIRTVWSIRSTLTMIVVEEQA
ncbi:MAG: Lrp/AsnC family transcriptional regulator [Candidatus Hodarchaeota archaeon]